MSYADTLVPGKVVNLRQRYGTLDPVAKTMSKDEALDFTAHALASCVWRMIEPTIQGRVDLSALIEEMYPVYLGVAQELGIQAKFLHALGIRAHDAPKNVLL